jgi:Transglycosylase SLT domain
MPHALRLRGWISSWPPIGRVALPNSTAAVLALLVLGLLMSSCAGSRQGIRSPHGYRSGGGSGYVKDNKPAIWRSNNPRIVEFRDHYRRTKTVETALDAGQPYLPSILAAFEKRRLPPELAYLPMLESMFENRADSGHARGLWQFTKQTAEHMGLRVSSMVDERLNWRKSSEAAADYLDALGERFNYDWGLALAAYNGGPGYIEDELKRQGRRDFFSLRLRKETNEYVPRFIAMIQVAKEKQLVAIR